MYGGYGYGYSPNYYPYGYGPYALPRFAPMSYVGQETLAPLPTAPTAEVSWRDFVIGAAVGAVLAIALGRAL